MTFGYSNLGKLTINHKSSVISKVMGLLHKPYKYNTLNNRN